MTAQDIQIKCQETPNPRALKFTVNSILKSDGKLTFTSPEQALDLPLVTALFLIEGVIQVFLQENTLTLTHSGACSNEDLEAQAKAVIKSRILVHNPHFSLKEEKPLQKKQERSHLPENILQVEEILDRTIRPGLMADGGDIEVVSFENDEIKIMYQGACGGCPSAMMGTLDAIQNILRHELKNPDLWIIPL